MFQAHALNKSGYIQSPPDGIWLSCVEDKMPFAYSDGQIEDWLYTLFSTTGDLSCGSAALEQFIHNWPSKYHLSPQRADLLRPLQHLFANKTVLEVGSGCGAITRYLGESAQKVIGVEGSMRRASIAKRRCADLKNVEVVASNIMDFSVDERFGMVTLVGVLEYSRKFIGDDDPVQALLQRCKSFLAEDGVLVIAIENQLGLKYLAGAPEDHTAKAYFGVHDSYGRADPVTFGRRELQERLARAGLQGTRYFYPFPDYKLPTTIVTEEGAQKGTVLMENLASSFSAFNQGNDYVRHFSEQASWGPVIRNGLMGELANSFLLVARRRPFSPSDDCLREAGDLAYVYSTRRTKQFHKESIIQQHADEVRVKRSRLYAHERPVRGPLSQQVTDEVAVQGPSMYRSLVRLVNLPGWTVEAVAAWAKPWAAFLLEQASQPSEPSALPSVPGILIDVSPSNLLWNEDGQLQCIDLEWDAGQKIPAHWVLLRGLVHSFTNMDLVAQPAPGTPVNSVALAAQVMALIGLPINKEECLGLLRLECSVFGGQPSELLDGKLSVRSDTVH